MRRTSLWLLTLYTPDFPTLLTLSLHVDPEDRARPTTMMATLPDYREDE